MKHIKTDKPTTILLFSALFAALITVSSNSFADTVNEPLLADGADAVAKQALVNINTADIESLTKLKGIGEKKAQAIIDYRQEYGQFETVEQLLNVKGVGIKIIEVNKAALRI
ncbi:helix-hairpin-helix domain-containing protein [Endozoicomonas sp. G2_1]|uniref:ComEA family DNA-binding protein n=1 Tax=Endozoicomonas sp. G2_1 TaxID=2821091 RepID=UPI001ADB1DCC|nr:ComEA family DNA-binding protein [Endozoicomonas sp. G2_1]MBO9490764.1 helix-hairpin-helix domain-containing protein [Endozoicomonas sp. G2_1]